MSEKWSNYLIYKQSSKILITALVIYFFFYMNWPTTAICFVAVSNLFSGLFIVCEQQLEEILFYTYFSEIISIIFMDSFSIFYKLFIVLLLFFLFILIYSSVFEGISAFNLNGIWFPFIQMNFIDEC